MNMKRTAIIPNNTALCKYVMKGHSPDLQNWSSFLPNPAYLSVAWVWYEIYSEYNYLC